MSLEFWIKITQKQHTAYCTFLSDYASVQFAYNLPLELKLNSALTQCYFSPLTLSGRSSSRKRTVFISKAWGCEEEALPARVGLHFLYLVISPTCSYLCWNHTQPISLLPSRSACSRSVVEMRHGWKSQRCGSAECCAWGVCVRLSGWICIIQTYLHLFFLHVWGWLCTFFGLNWLYVYVDLCVRVCACVCVCADTHRDTGLSHPVCTISPNDDTLWLIEFFICPPTSSWHPFRLRFFFKKKKVFQLCVRACVCVSGGACPPLYTAGDICQFNWTRKCECSCMWVSSVCLKKIMCE